MSYARFSVQPTLKVYDIDFDGTGEHIMAWLLQNAEIIRSVLTPTTKADNENFAENKKIVKDGLLQFVIVRMIAADLQQPNTIVRFCNFSRRQDLLMDTYTRYLFFDILKRDSGSVFFFLQKFNMLLRTVFDLDKKAGIAKLDLDTACMPEFFDKELAVKDDFNQFLTSRITTIYKKKADLYFYGIYKKMHLTSLDEYKKMLVIAHAHHFAELYPNYKLTYTAFDDQEQFINELEGYFIEHVHLLPVMQARFIRYINTQNKSSIFDKGIDLSYPVVGKGYDKDYRLLLENMRQQLPLVSKPQQREYQVDRCVAHSAELITRHIR